MRSDKRISLFYQVHCAPLGRVCVLSKCLQMDMDERKFRDRGREGEGERETKSEGEREIWNEIN